MGADRGVEAGDPTGGVEEPLEAGLFSYGPPACVGIEVFGLQVGRDTVAFEQQGPDCSAIEPHDRGEGTAGPMICDASEP